MASLVPPPPDGGSSEQGAVAMSNGPVDGVRSWERAWRVDEMRKEAGNWSLAGDAGLLLHLQEFSQRMISRVHEIEKEVDGLLNDSKLTSVRVNNVFNDFIMLANTQFVENRVYDEDVSQETEVKEEAKPEEHEKTREQREAELIPKVKEALTLGINVIDEAFEKLDCHVADSDSEDDDETGYRVDPIMEPKDPYISRPLPLLIGTPNFLQDDNVGLLEDESEEEESDHGSISESESEEENQEEPESSDEYSDSESDSESEKPRTRPPPRKATRGSSSESDESDDDLFGGKDKGSDDEGDESEESEEDESGPAKPPQPKGPADFASELAKKIGAPVMKPPDSDEEGDEFVDEEPTRKKKGSERKRNESESSQRKRNKSKDKPSKKKTSVEEEDPFGAPEEEDSPFGTSGGLFSAGKSMFADDNDEGGLFDDVEKDVEEKPKSRKHSSHKKPAGGGALFKGEEGEDGMFGSGPKERSDSGKKATSISAPPKQKGGGGFFDDDDDEEDEGDLFAASSSKKTHAKKKRGPSKSGLSEDDEGDLFASGSAAKPPEEKKKPKLPAGAVSMFGSGPNSITAALKKQHPPSDEEESDKSRSSSIKSNQSQSSLTSKHVDRIKEEARSSSSNSLFDDDADDALFTSLPKPRADSQSKAKQTVALFGDDNDEDDGLFGMEKKPAKSASTAKGLATEKPRSGSLFGEEENGDELFGEAPPKPAMGGSRKPVGGVALFGGVDILGKKAEPTPTPAQKEQPPKKQEAPKAASPKKSSLSLFDENEDDEDLLFGGDVTVETMAPQAKMSPGGKRDLFGDDDILFGGVDEESPGVDLFGSPGTSPVKSVPPPTKTTPPTKAPVAKVTQKPASDMFDDDDDDEDMFASAVSKDRAESGDKVPVAGVTTEESTDSPKKEEPTTKSKKPVGGVAIMGGINPFAGVKQRRPIGASDDEEEEKDDVVSTKPKVKVPPKPIQSVKKAAPVDPLFGDDDDDMFSVTKPKPRPSSHSSAKPKPPQSKKPEDVFSPNKPLASKPTSRPPLDDDDDDNLFGRKPPPVEDKPAPVSRGGGKDIFGSPSSDGGDLFGSSPPATEEPQVAPPKVKKPPFGAVSMFGGLDPFAAMKKKTPVEIEKTRIESGTGNKPVSKPTSRPPLDDDDDDDNLFGRKPPPVEDKPASVSRGGERDLVGSPPSDGGDLFGRKPPPVEDKPASVSRGGGKDIFGSPPSDGGDLVGRKPPPVQDKPAPVSRGGGRNIFGSPPSDGGDLFGRKPPPVQDKPAPVSRGGGKDIFGSPSSDGGDLFGSSPPATEEPQVVPPKVKKPPAGAVSMFGGLDPFTVMKKKQETEKMRRESESEDKLSASVEIQKPISPTKDIAPPSFGTKRPDPASSGRGVLPPSPTKGPESGAPTRGPIGKIGKLKMNIGINPAALLPGAAPPIKEPEPVPVGFDIPADVTTLHSASKDRPRIQSKRRPPSRVARRSQDDSSGSDALSPSSPPGGDIPRMAAPSKVVNDRVPQPTSDLFGNDDLLDGSSTKPFVKPTPIVEENDIFSSGAFSSGAKVTKPKVSDDSLFAAPRKPVTKSSDSDDIFSASSTQTSRKTSAIVTPKGDDDLFAPKSSAMPAKPAVSKETEYEDIFATKSKSNKQSVLDDELFGPTSKSSNPEVLPPSEDVSSKKVVQNDDDMFGDTSLPKTETKPPGTKPPDASDQVNDDDIFAGATNTVKKVTKPAVEQEDELFGKPSGGDKKKRQVRRAPKTEDKDIFKDDTDIFADLPAAKPKEKKKKKATTATSKALFKDAGDLDDIFGDATKKTKTKKTKKTQQTTEKKTAVNADDIFDDPLGKV